MRHSIAASLSVLLAAGFSPADADSLRIGTEGAYPPFNFIGDSGEVEGFEREFGDELCRRIGADCIWLTNAWDTLIPNLKAGNFDLLIATMGITPERREVIAFSSDYLPPESSAYAALGTAPDPLVTVSTQTGTIQASHLAASGATVIEFPTMEDAVAAMRNGEADAVFAGRSYLDQVVGSSDGAIGYRGEEVVLNYGAGVGVRPGSGPLLQRLDDAIAAMKEDGSLNAMIAEWLGPDANRY